MMMFSEAIEYVNLKMSHGKSEGHVHRSTYDCIHVCVNYFHRNSGQTYGKPYVLGGKGSGVFNISKPGNLTWSDRCVESMCDSGL